MAATYLDFNATAPLKPKVIEAVAEAMAVAGNPSSQHKFGRDARRLVELGREALAERLKVRPSSIVFTGSGTEADNLALLQNTNCLVSAVEHPALLSSIGADKHLPVHPNGLLNMDRLEQALQTGTGVLSVQLVNSETGVIQPVAEIVAIAKQAGWLVHTDAVQALGKLDFDFPSLGVDMMTVSAHKIGGPQGVAALVVRSGLDLQPLLTGGGQERNRRSGTENVAGIAGFGRAVELLDEDLSNQPQLASWRDAFEVAVTKAVPETRLFGNDADRVANTSCLSMPHVAAATQLMAFDLKGFAVSAGSACSSGKAAASPVLRAMGVAADVASQAIRMSLGWSTQEAEVKAFTKAWIDRANKTTK